MSGMNLGDGFSRRKQIQNEITIWLRRLSLSGREDSTYQVETLGDSEEKATPGSLKKFSRDFTIYECLEKLQALIKEDGLLAKRISLTNQKAGALVIDLKGVSVFLTIPELIVLKNDIVPKLQEVEDNIPQQSTRVEIIEEGKDESDEKFIKWRDIKTLISRTREITANGLQRDVDVIKGYNIVEVKDFGYDSRTILDRKDRLREWENRLKKAINESNKTLLINLESEA